MFVLIGVDGLLLTEWSWIYVFFWYLRYKFDIILRRVGILSFKRNIDLCISDQYLDGYNLRGKDEYGR